MTRAGQWPPAPAPLPAPLVDNHCHLEYPAGDEPRSVEDRLADAAATGVTRVVQVGCEVESAEWTVDAVQRYPQMVGGVAIHPNEAARLDAVGEYDAAFERIADLARADRIRVVSETGLDFFRTGPDGVDAQVRAFRDHIALAKELGLPMQIHDRDAHAEVLEVLDRDGAPEQTVFHCFSGDAGLAQLAVQRGWFLSYAGTVTFKNAGGLRAALAVTPLSQVLIETDSPFLTAHPHRGTPNHPALAALTARTVAEVLETDLATVCATVSETSSQLYGPW
ncbi:TatD family hydrolase [Demequina sp. B12]|uniref:TatD family hydrolase n=1 Tax=Demequina sp. B12 TaxID=2992757 RepID=UPI00237A6807|nr:TatD family hydrolase [Demequina sp. B12]MDE0573757.1 TatD family hydrolase [Demequina sp. B12]